jgi:hypothetical protein
MRDEQRNFISMKTVVGGFSQVRTASTWVEPSSQGRSFLG